MTCSPRLARCSVACGHWQFVTDYRRERDRSEQVAVEASNGYPTELADYLDRRPLPTFKDWLLGTRRPPEDRQLPAPVDGPGWEL
jgi:hypothetical protein